MKSIINRKKFNFFILLFLSSLNFAYLKYYNNKYNLIINIFKQ